MPPLQDRWGELAKDFKAGPASPATPPEVPAQSPAPSDDWKIWASAPAAPAAEPLPQTFGHGLTEFGKQINPIPMITGAANTILHPLDTARSLIGAQANEFSQVPSLIRQGRYTEAAGHGAAGLVPLVGPAAARIGEQMGGGTITDKNGIAQPDPNRPADPAGGLGAGAGLLTSILAAPKVTETAGKALKGTAGSLVKSALGLPGKAEAYGANPAGAVLNDTTGIRPSTIAQTGQQRITDLSRDLDAATASSTARPSLTPARNILSRESTAAAGANSEQTPREIARMSKQLTDVRPGFNGATTYAPGASTPVQFKPAVGMAPGPPRMIRGASPDPILAAEQPAKQFLDMKRQFNDDHIANWNPTASTKHSLGVARQVYGSMADELHRTVHGAEGIDSRIQSLIPAVDRAKAVSTNAGALQKAMDRISRPTGALVPALIGKQIGGIPGMLAGLGVPEMISAPAVKMTFARALNGGGNVLGSPLTQRGAQVLPLLKRSQ